MSAKLISCVSCQDEEFIWCYDEILCALSRICKKTLQAECVIPPGQILPGREYEVRKMVVWKEKLLILPVQLNQRWVIYDKKNKEIKYGFFCSENYRAVEVILSGDKLFALPCLADDPILVINLRENTVWGKLYLQEADFGEESGMEIWNARAEKEEICFLVRDSEFYGRLSEKEGHFVKIQVPEPLLCADFIGNRGWGVGRSGNHLYQFDKDGELRGDYFIGTGVEFARLLIKDSTIYLLPMEGSNIRGFDIEQKRLLEFHIPEETILSDLPEVPNLPAYWEYEEVGEELWFLPLRYPLQIFDPQTWTWRQRVVEYSGQDVKRAYWNSYLEARKIKGACIFHESAKGELDGFLELVKHSDSVSERQESRSAEKIWKMIR